MKAFCTTICVLLFISAVSADTPINLVPAKTAKTAVKETTVNTINLTMPTAPVAVGDMVQIVVQGIPATALPKTKVWVAPPDNTTMIVGQGLKSGDPVFIVFRATAAGTYTFIVAAPDGTGDLLSTQQALVVGTSPTPPPGPTPPGPTPPPGPVTKLRVLVLYDPADVVNMSEPQRQVIFSGAPDSMRAYLDTHCIVDTVKDASGGSDSLAAKRIWPTNVDPAAAGALWKPLLTTAAGKPGVIVQAGDKITRYDLPVTNADALKLLAPLGGP